MILVSLIVAVGAFAFVALGIQDHNNRFLTAQMLGSEAELRASGAKNRGN
jgi:hypothetical protein